VTGYCGDELERTALGEAPRLSKPYHRADFIVMAVLLRQEVVCRRAYAIWKREGQPDGQADRHWSMAEQELQAIAQAPPAGSLNHLRSGDRASH